jgi:glycosyltransferase 2 family protein
LPVNLLIKILISAAAIAVLAVHLDGEKLAGVFPHISVHIWGLALAALLAQISLLTYRWMLFVNADRPRIDYFTALRINVAALLANFLLLTSISGVFVKVALTTQYGFPFVKSVCAAVADRFLTLAALLVFAVIFLPLLKSYVDLEPFILASLVLTGFVYLAFIFMPAFVKNMLRDLIFMNRKVTLIAHYIRSLLLNQALLFRLIVFSLAAQFCYFLAIQFVALSLDVSLPFYKLLAVLPFVTLAASLPIGFGGWGLREGAFIYGLGLLGVPAETAFIISVHVGLLSIVSAVVAGIPAIVTGDARGLIRAAVTSRHARRPAAGR